MYNSEDRQVYLQADSCELQWVCTLYVKLFGAKRLSRARLYSRCKTCESTCVFCGSFDWPTITQKTLYKRGTFSLEIYLFCFGAGIKRKERAASALYRLLIHALLESTSRGFYESSESFVCMYAAPTVYNTLRALE